MKRLRFAALLLALVGGAFLGGAWVGWHAARRTAGLAGRQPLYWVDPMHPSYRSDKPGIAPDCGMRLEPVYAEGAAAAGESRPAGSFRVSPERQQAIGVRVATVEVSPVQRAVRTVGRVAVDENRLYRLVASVDGLVRELRPVPAGSFVGRDEVLLTYYSPEFLGAQQAYFYALKTLDRISGDRAEPNEQTVLTNAQLRSAVDTLRNMGMSETQIAEIGKTRRLVRDVELRSPAAGYVLSRSVLPRQRLERGAELFRIADLSRVWILANVSESDAPYLRSGAEAVVSFPFGRRAPVRTRVAALLPQLDPQTRTLQARLEIDNPTTALRPEMFVDVEIAATLPAAVTVPADAVVDSGLRTMVFIDRGNGFLERRRVETGWRVGERVEIVKGLMAGERIVVSGNFLLDSESRLRAAAAGVMTPETDPVCGMEVDQAKAREAGHTSRHAGAVYYFCSDSCRKRFEAEPARYAGQPEAVLTRAEPATAPASGRARHTASGPKHTGAADGNGGGGDARVREADAELNVTAAVAAGRTIFATDPVCGAEVDTTAEGALKSAYAGTTYYFVMQECKETFEKDPARYAARPAAAPAAATDPSAADDRPRP